MHTRHKMYFSASLPADRMSTSITSLYDISPSLSTTITDSYNTATCAYPSWPRRPSLHSNTASSSRSSSPIAISRSTQRETSPEVMNAWISDEDIFPEAFVPQYAAQRRHYPNPLAAHPCHVDDYDDLPAESPVGSLPRGSAVSLSSMSPKQLAMHMAAMRAERLEAALFLAKEQARESRRRRRTSAIKRKSV